jgi:hypothetical protein
MQAAIADWDWNALSGLGFGALEPKSVSWLWSGLARRVAIMGNEHESRSFAGAPDG